MNTDLKGMNNMFFHNRQSYNILNNPHFAVQEGGGGM